MEKLKKIWENAIAEQENKEAYGDYELVISPYPDDKRLRNVEIHQRGKQIDPMKDAKLQGLEPVRVQFQFTPVQVMDSRELDQLRRSLGLMALRKRF